MTPISYFTHRFDCVHEQLMQNMTLRQRTILGALELRISEKVLSSSLNE